MTFYPAMDRLVVTPLDYRPKQAKLNRLAVKPQNLYRQLWEYMVTFLTEANAGLFFHSELTFVDSCDKVSMT